MQIQSRDVKVQIQNELAKLLPQMKRVVHMIEKANDDWMDHYERLNPNDMFLRQIFYGISENLYKAQRSVQILQAPIVEEGRLYKNASGRYEYRKGCYFTSGCPIEFLYADADEEMSWISSHIEHNGNDYYIVGYPKVSMDGLKIRIRLRG